MDTERRIALALRKQRLLQRSAALRQQIGEQSQPLRPWLGRADQLRRAYVWLRQHPALPIALASGGAAFMATRPRMLLRWLRRGWWLWQMRGRWRAVLERMSGSGAPQKR